MRGHLMSGLGLLLGLTAAWAGSSEASAPAPSTRPASSADSGPSTQPTAESRELEARRRLAAGLRPAAGVGPARPADAEARERFMAIERVARLPAAEQARELARFYRDQAQRSMSAGDIIGLSSIPTNILDPTHFSGSPGNSETWGKQLADAASNLTAEQVADKLKEGQWLNMASRARAIWVLKAHAKATEALVHEDLKSGQKQLVQRGIKTIRDLDLRTFTGQLLTLFLAEGESSEAAGRALLFMRDPALVQPLLARVEKDPKFLVRYAGYFQGPLYRKPAEPLLLKLLDSPDANVRYHAGYALYECRDPKLAAPAVRFAREKEPRFRVMAAYWASNLPVDSFAAVRYDLMLLLTDTDESVRTKALCAFAQQKDLAACPVILDMLIRNHPGPAGQYKTAVMQALGALAGQQFGYDSHNWGPGSPGNQRAIVEFEAWMALVGAPVPRSFEPGEGDRPVTSTATSTSSGQATQPAAGPAEIERLIEQLGTEKLADRVVAQQALVKIGLSAVEALQAASNDKDPERANRAKVAIAEITLSIRRSSRFAIYRVTSSAKFSGDMEKLAIKDLTLGDDPILCDQDITEYDWDSHLIRLTPEANAKLDKLGALNVFFVVVVEGQRRYLGLIRSPVSSHIGRVPTINLDRADPAAPDNKLPANSVLIRILVRGAPDPRSDPRIRRALEAAGKLKATATQPAPEGAIASPAAGPAEIERLITQLGSEEFARREVAQQSLVKTGLPAVGSLQKAASDENAERAGRAKAALEQISWGQPNQGLRARLLPLRFTWSTGRTVELSLDIRNGGKRAVEYSNAQMLYCQVQVDGVWHSWARPFVLGLPTGMLAPGKEFTLKLRLTDDWGTPPGNAPGASAKDTKWLRLEPGSHLVRVSFTGYPELGNREGGIRCESNPVQVEIEGRSATKPATSAGSGQAPNGAIAQPEK